MRELILQILILMIFTSVASAQDIDVLWKARALKASENIEVLSRQKDTKENRVKLMVESAYALILMEPDIVRKQTPSVVIYHLIFNYGSDGIFDIGYVYDAKTYRFMGTRIDRLPKHRAIIHMADSRASDFIALKNYQDESEPIIMFSQSNPFLTDVVK